jgi:TolA-binding protein
MDDTLDKETQEVNSIKAELDTVKEKVTTQVDSLQSQLDAANAEIAKLQSQGVDTSALDAAIAGAQASADALSAAVTPPAGNA